MFIFHFYLLLFWKCHSSRQRPGSYGTTAALQAFPFVIATNGVAACGFVSVRVRAPVIVDPTAVATRNSLKNRGTIQFLLLFPIFAMLSTAAAAVCLCHAVSF